jgi:hypothetical protein
MPQAPQRSTRHPARPPRVRILAALVLLGALPLLAQIDSALQYQNRGDRYEGLKPKPVSGYDIELLSALVDWRESGAGWPATLRLKFYLPAEDRVFVTVRQPRPKTTYYWLDKVKPPSPWRRSAFNEYAWPTEPVLRKLPSVTLDDLGAVVRLRQADPSKREAVAPAALYSLRPPAIADGYRFTFKTNGTAFVTCTIYRGDQKVFQRPQNRERAGSPFTLDWETRGQPDGEYRLALSGYFDDNTPLVKEIVFHHRAAWK